MADKAHAKTDRKIEQMEKRLSGIYSGSADIIEKKAADYFRQFERLDEKKRKQVEAGLVYDEAVDGMPCRYTYEETEEPVEGMD